MTQSIREGLAGARALMRFDAHGLALVGDTAAAARFSFIGMLLVVPLEPMLRPSPDGSGLDVVAILVVNVLGYIISWLAFPALAAELLPRIGLAGRLYGYIAAINWLRTLERVLEVGLLLVASLPNRQIAMLALVMSFILLVLRFGWRWFIARRALGVTGRMAAVFVGLDLLCEMAVFLWVAGTVNPGGFSAQLQQMSPG